MRHRTACSTLCGGLSVLAQRAGQAASGRWYPGPPRLGGAATQMWVSRRAEDALLQLALGQVLHQEQALKPRRARVSKALCQHHRQKEEERALWGGRVTGLDVLSVGAVNEDLPSSLRQNPALLRALLFCSVSTV